MASTRVINIGRYVACIILAAIIIWPSYYICAQQKSNVAFKKIVLTSDFISEGVAVGDVNHDGKTDIMAGAFWFEAPNWTRHEIDSAKSWPDTAYSNSFLNFSMDVNGDGWIDFIRMGYPGQELVWYENPQNKPGHWIMHTIGKNIGNETPAFVDVDGDGRPDIVCNDPVAKEVIWFKPPTKKGDTLWQRFVISKGDLATTKFTHGLGVGDINGDGKRDIFITKGWWQQPADITKGEWIFHPADLGDDCAEMYPLDVNGDGKVDIISSSAHDYGIWWHEQIVKPGGGIDFVTHEIYKGFSETHGLVMTDINGDGFPDLITGKRYFAHNGGDRGGRDAAVLYWFEFKPGKQPVWIPHQIDDNSGVGINFVVKDMNHDGLPDIVIANKKGVFLFQQVKQ